MVEEYHRLVPTLCNTREWVGYSEGEGTSYEDASVQHSGGCCLDGPALSHPPVPTRACTALGASKVSLPTDRIRHHRQWRIKAKLTKEATVNRRDEHNDTQLCIISKEIKIKGCTSSHLRAAAYADKELYHGWSRASEPLKTRMRRNPEEIWFRTWWGTEGIGQGIVRDEAVRGSAALDNLQDRSE
ncbi:hypothetical protein B0H13DRAFT_1917501 [Mycena leptocephala]|nr:hypothetical protein B0H13DRAFT_1917501 [Mycena leptocephala]